MLGNFEIHILEHRLLLLLSHLPVWHWRAYTKRLGLYKVLTHSQGNLEAKGEPRTNTVQEKPTPRLNWNHKPPGDRPGTTLGGQAWRDNICYIVYIYYHTYSILCVIIIKL